RQMRPHQMRETPPSPWAHRHPDPSCEPAVSYHTCRSLQLKFDLNAKHTTNRCSDQLTQETRQLSLDWLQPVRSQRIKGQRFGQTPVRTVRRDIARSPGAGCPKTTHYVLDLFNLRYMAAV